MNRHPPISPPMIYVSRLRRLWIMDRILLMPGTVSEYVQSGSQSGTMSKDVKSHGLSTPTIRVCMAPSEDR
jgi:hypothetical protein